jgi:ABC-2 type transport system ATP-binding protein
VNRDILRQELRSLKIEFEEGSSFKIRAKGADLQRILRSIETPLSLVKTHDPSLEDAYLKIIKES